MTGFIFLAAILVPAALAWPLARSALLRGRSWSLRISALAAAGWSLLAVEMLLLSWLGVRWSPPLLCTPFVALWVVLRKPPESPPSWPTPMRDSLPGLLLCGVAVVLVAWAAAATTATSSDLLYFWGTKGQRFALARGIDVAFLADPRNYLMHSDYPPLLPLLYAWCSLVAGRFAWGATLLFLPIFLGLLALSFWGTARDAMPSRQAAELTALLTAVLGYPLVVTHTAGNADAMLLFFEALALGALTLARRSGEGDWLATLGLSAAAMTKLEGILFAVTVAVVFGVDRGRGLGVARIFRLGALPAACAGLWYGFCRAHALTDLLRPPTLTLEPLPAILRSVGTEASYGVAYLPWLAVGTLWFAIPMRRVCWRAFAVGALSIATICFYYLSARADPSLWIRWSASRLLITPLLCFFFAAAAAHRDPAPVAGAGAS